MQYILIFTGGGIGACLRLWFGNLIAQKAPSSLPYGTLSVNLIGCFVLGLVYFYMQHKYYSEDIRNFLIVGLIGGFTTFSTFTLENIQMLQTKQYLSCIIYILISVVGGMVALWLAYQFSKILFN